VSADLEARLERVLDERYHHLHPFNLRMHAGELSRDEIRTWVANRYYYQTRIPKKDGLIVTKADDPAFRRDWTRRIRDHEGEAGREGGLELWLRLSEAVGLDREQVALCRDVLPGVRRACDAYVEFVASHDLLESVAASLTERRAGAIMEVRIEAWEKHYSWVTTAGLAYFRNRTEQAPRDASEGLAYVLGHVQSPADADGCCAALERKCEILWSLLDAVEWGGRVPTLAPGMRLREDPEGGSLAVGAERAVRLNDTGREILELCCDGRSVCEVGASFAAQHATEAGASEDAYAFLEAMESQRVIRCSHQA